MGTKTEESTTLTLRADYFVKKQLRENAKAEGISLSAYCVKLLKKKLEQVQNDRT